MRANADRPPGGSYHDSLLPALIAVGAAAVIVLAAVVLAKPAPHESVGSSPITAGPYTSPLFAYTVDIPAGWEVVPASKPWPAGQRIETDPASVDTFRIPGSPINASMAVAAQHAPQGTHVDHLAYEVGGDT